MPLNDIDTAGIARSLAQIAEPEVDHVDAYLEIERSLALEGDEEALEPVARVDSGLAVRLLRDGRSWLASADELSPDAFCDAVARVARARPRAVAPAPRTVGEAPASELETEPLRAFVDAVAAAVRKRHAAFPRRWKVGAHHRLQRVVGAMLAPPAQSERFYSCRVETPWGGAGALLTALDAHAVESLADAVTSIFRVRRREESPAGRQPVLLGPAATAVLLHEAVAHVLEADTLAMTGHPEAAIGVALAGSGVEVVDDWERAPEPIRRTVDDEGMPVVRRALLREGAVVAPLADLAATGTSPRLLPGAGRRSGRHTAPVPRSYRLELVPPADGASDLLGTATSGLYVRQFEGGRLDPVTGDVELRFAWARRLDGGGLGRLCSAGRIRGSVGALLRSIATIGADAQEAGAGWCAKGGHRLPVWARAPSLLLDDVEVEG